MIEGRSFSREVALKLLYQAQIKGLVPHDWTTFFDFSDMETRTQKWATDLAGSVWQHREELDACLVQYSIDWELDRIAKIDRAIMWMAFFELIYTKTDPPVIINEAIELSKRFSSDESPRYINGILGKYVEKECSQELSKD